MPERRDKHGPRLDDEIGHETQGMVRGNHPTRVEEFRETEAFSDDGPWDPTAAAGDPREGAPPGMTPGDVEGRSNLARMLTGVRWPARPGDLVEHVNRAAAPDGAVAALETLPDREYENLADVAEELGYGRETRRF
ncbi:DUF2795 domain-containing protein [Actinomadura fibrosa]|uniref:DUF2795 domain-containing protein n=1 Tax=Actinomadura fibrosa TaxID=111802 RepID=A0ABW2XJH1_9ACTN|nr:DUF2795 domain-containing protein [Actinomadura fibrosa]